METPQGLLQGPHGAAVPSLPMPMLLTAYMAVPLSLPGPCLSSLEARAGESDFIGHCGAHEGVWGFHFGKTYRIGYLPF